MPRLWLCDTLKSQAQSSLLATTLVGKSLSYPAVIINFHQLSQYSGSFLNVLFWRHSLHGRIQRLYHVDAHQKYLENKEIQVYDLVFFR